MNLPTFFTQRHTLPSDHKNGPLDAQKKERIWSVFTCSLAIVSLMLLFLSDFDHVTSFISPILAPLQQLYTKNTDTVANTFAFAPLWSSNRMQKIDYKGLSMLSFYDIPVNKDGTLDKDTDGYQTLKSSEAEDLFTLSRFHGTKVFITFTQTNKKDILSFLSNAHAQQQLTQEISKEIHETHADGATIAFEYDGQVPRIYQFAYTAFIKQLKENLKGNNPDTQISIALGNTRDASSLYDIRELARVVDKVFLMAYSLPVPEMRDGVVISPVYGYDSDVYTKQITQYVADFAKDIPSEKLVMERAWYGNGDNYPLYRAKTKNTTTENFNSLTTPLPQLLIDQLVSGVSYEDQISIRQNLPFIAKALEKEGILNPNVLAYALATIEHETAETFQPIDEYKGRKNARRFGYEGGTNYFGRGFIQLTHERNYRAVGERIGLGEKLVLQPELASHPEIAARVLAAFFRDNNVARMATQGEFVAARRPINPDTQGLWVAELTWKYLAQG